MKLLTLLTTVCVFFCSVFCPLNYGQILLVNASDNNDVYSQQTSYNKLTVNTNTNGQENTNVTCQDKTMVAIFMYHSVLKNFSNTYTVTPTAVENDIVYLLKNGYQIIDGRDLVAFSKGKTLDSKCAILSFDDGFYNFYYYVFPLLKKYKVKAVLSVVGTYTDKDDKVNQSANYSYVNYKQIKEMYNSGLVEIANHTYNMHGGSGRQGVSRLSNENVESYKKSISSDIKKWSDILDKRGIPMTTFTYPYGKYNKIASSVVSSLGYKVVFTCNLGINYLTPKSQFIALKRLLRTPNTSAHYLISKYSK